jgi:hypothetical protein
VGKLTRGQNAIEQREGEAQLWSLPRGLVAVLRVVAAMWIVEPSRFALERRKEVFRMRRR